MIKLLALVLFISSSHAAITVIGSDGETDQILGTISQEEYTQTILMTKSGLDKEIIENLNAPSHSSWKMDKISVGVGATGEVGIGPYKFGTALKQRFIFAR